MFEDGTYTFKSDELHISLQSEVRSMCNKKMPDCGYVEISKVRDKDRAKYQQVKFNSPFDFLFHADCKTKNKKTVTYVCHMKVTPSLEPNGLKFKISPAELIEMD